jgi:hypothetical protein
MPALSSPIVLRNAEDVRAVRRSRRLYARHPIVFQLPELAEPDADSLARRVNEYRDECGCSLGAKWMTAALILAGAWLALRPSVAAPAPPVRVAIALLFVLASAGTGKVLGIVLAHRKLRRVFDQLLFAASHRSVGG